MARRRARKADHGKAIGYVRVSTAEQAREGVSLDAQERAIRAYCEMRGLELVELVVDAGVSAGTELENRDGGARVLDAVRSGRAGSVVVTKLDRAFRNTADCLDVVSGWDRAGVAFHLVDMGGTSVDTSSAMGRFFVTQLAAIAELERGLIGERIAVAKAEKRQRGEFNGGEAPFGWRVADDGATLEAHEAEQEIIAGARELRSAGMSLRAIGRELEIRGFKTRTGKAWTHPQRVSWLLEAKAA